MREQSFSFILKISVLDTSQDSTREPVLSAAEGMVLRGSLRQVGLEQPRHFVSFERLVEILQETMTLPAPPVPPAQSHTEQAPPTG